MVVHDPGDAQRGKSTSTTQDRHDPSKAKALDGLNEPNGTAIGEKLIKQDHNSEFTGDNAVAVAADASSKQIAADAEMAMELELEFELADGPDIDSNNGHGYQYRSRRRRRRR